MSIRITQQALDDQAVLRDHVGHFLLDAHAMPGLDLGARIDVIERTAAFLVEMLLPHAAAEEHVLYPGATRLLGCADEQTTVNEDRAAVRELLGQLAFADPADAGALQEILYALYALLSAHFWREEQVLMRLAGARDERRVHDVMDRMAAMTPARRRFEPRARRVSGASA